MLSEFLKFTDVGILGICLVMLFLKWQEMKDADRADERDDETARLRIEADTEITKVLTELKTIITERIPPKRG